jgi:hypothetical protein
MGRRRTSARVDDVPKRFSFAWPAGFGLQVLDTMEGVLGLMPVLLSPVGRSRSPLARRSNSASRSALKTERDVRQQIGRIQKDSDSAVPTGDEGNVRGRHDSVKALQDPRRFTESSHPQR